MKVDIIESINLCLNKEEKSVLLSIIDVVEKIRSINLDSNNALEEIDEIQKNIKLEEFVDIFSSLRPTKEEGNALE